jgi:hypothetical protein
MATKTQNRRIQTRFAVKATTQATVRFTHPGTKGDDQLLSVVNVSASGISFQVEADQGMHELEEGTTLEEVQLQIGGCMMSGDLLVMYVTRAADSGYVCGALFYPASDTDLVKLKSVVAGMEVAGAD